MSPKAAAKVPKDQAGLVERAVRVLRRREEAEAYVASVCFKHGPPRLLGVELEWLLARRADPPSRPPVQLDATTLVTALGPHTPPSLDPLSPALPLPSGSSVTVEPGGQVEIASRPFADLGSLVDAVQSDAAALHGRLGRYDLLPSRYAADPVLPARRMLTVPRYTAMEAAFDRRGTEGRSMM
ncbi:MAG: ergothioneine biosynthesis glutamate--cysteine ligase EgtA, partial [Pseudonocardia sp.]|nr:ergothioneine biosynthesis glutamate--cysteine ligase EgtA [Pseudonocardia sp.]